MPGNETLLRRANEIRGQALNDIFERIQTCIEDLAALTVEEAIREELPVRAGTPAAPPCDNPDHPDPALKSYYQEGDTTAPPCARCRGAGEVPCMTVNDCDDPDDGYVPCPACAASEEA